MTLIPNRAIVTPFGDKIRAITTHELPNDWYQRATMILRGGVSGEHGLLLYKLIRQSFNCVDTPIVLDVGTARGFSAIIMARAISDMNLHGEIYTIDVLKHDELLDWHADKQRPDEPLASIPTSRFRIWDRWYPDEASKISVITGKSYKVLNDWKHGPIDFAFLDGSHTYETVKQELELLDRLMSQTGVLILDDYHIGLGVARFRSRLVNGVIRVVSYIFDKLNRLNVPQFVLGTDTAFVIVKQRYSGLTKAVREFLAEKDHRWSLEIITMPPRTGYQGVDYSIAILTRSKKSH